MNGKECLEIWKDIKNYEGLYQISNFVNGKKPVKKTFFEKLKTLGINMGVKL